MAHITGSGPAYATATVFIRATGALATIYSDVGLTIETRNPFPLVAGLYDFYSAVDVYVVVGIGRQIYETTDGAVDRDEYLAPKDFPL